MGNIFKKLRSAFSFQTVGDRLNRLTSPVPLGLWIVNTLMQRVFRVNGNVPWMVHFTSRVTAYSPAKVRLGKNVWKSLALSGG
jgi:hypothetical protein